MAQSRFGISWSNLLFESAMLSVLATSINSSQQDVCISRIASEVRVQQLVVHTASCPRAAWMTFWVCRTDSFLWHAWLKLKLKPCLCSCGRKCSYTAHGGDTRRSSGHPFSQPFGRLKTPVAHIFTCVDVCDAAVTLPRNVSCRY